MRPNFIKYKAVLMSLPQFDLPLLPKREIFAKIGQF